MRARECRLYLALSIIAPSVNVLGRTRRKPSTIRGAAPEVVIGQSTAAPAGARPLADWPPSTPWRCTIIRYMLMFRERVPTIRPRGSGVLTIAVGRDLHEFARLSYVDAHGQSPGK